MIDTQGNDVFYVEELDVPKNSRTLNARWTVAKSYITLGETHALCMFVGGHLRMFVFPDCWGSHTWKRDSEI